MKAGVLYSNEDIRFEDMETPQINADEILVKVHMTGICGSDVPRVLHNGAHFYPIILGHEFSGEVVEIGSNVEGFEIGDKVSGVPLVPCMKCDDCQKGNYSLCKHYSFIGSREQGSFAEYIKLPARNTVKFDKSLSYEQGALFEPSTVALHGIRCADYVGGKDVAVLGGGTIGLFTMQWAKIFGAKSITVFDINDARLELAKKLGADYTINSLRDEIPNGKFDFVFETAGNPKTILNAFDIAANKAKVCFIGTPHNEVVFTPKQWENLNRKEMMVTGSWMSYSSSFPGEEWELTAHFFKTGQLKYDEEMVFKKMPLSDIKEAFMMFKEPGLVNGKIMIYSN